MIHLIKKYLVFIVIGLAILIGLFVIRYQETKAIDDEEAFSPLALVEEVEENDDSLEEAQTWLVDIKGEVEKPGVYEVESVARVNDVITLAGGFTKEADQNFINLAQKVQDEMVIIVPKEDDDQVVGNTPLQTPNNQDGEKVKINQATKEEIESLPGIGPSKAQAIIDYREENGSFQQVEDLIQVNGIGEKTLDNLRDHISIP